MMSYKDMTFCPFWKDCAYAKGCPRALTPDVKEAAVNWWGNESAPIALFVNPPTCYVEKS